VREILAIARTNLKSLPTRIGPSSVVVFGIAGVVLVFLLLIGMVLGIKQALLNTGRADRGLIVRNGSASELVSVITPEQNRRIASLVAQQLGDATVSSESLVTAIMMRTNGVEASAPLRGIGPNGAPLRPEIRITQGRMFAPGELEVIVGAKASRQYRNATVGSTISAFDSDWTVVGVFTSEGDAHESEIITDVRTLMDETRRFAYQSLLVKFDSELDFQKLKQRLRDTQVLGVELMRETEYFEQQSAKMSRLLLLIAYSIGSAMTLTAAICAANAMYSSLRTRVREIAVLRAVGYSGITVVIAILIEALFLALLGGALGGVLGWLIFDGYALSSRVSGQGAAGPTGLLLYSLEIGGPTVAYTIVLAIALAILSGIAPAIYAARVSVTQALRAA
jgi:putative ABC transport system permease protein